ncbi:MAG: hypothetical protein WDN27_01035 [Candidatus Saccharibacteria bacterium]
MPPAAVKEITRIKNDAIVTGVRTGFAGTAIATAAALVLSLTLPKRAQQHAYEPAAAAE